MAVNPNGGNITSSPLATPINVGAGTHQQSIKVVATSPIPVNTPISTSFSVGARGCASTLSVSFPQPIPECFRLRTNAMTCQPGAKLRMSHSLDGISGNSVNGTLVITATGATFSAPSAGGTLNNPNQLTFSVGNPAGGTFNFEYDLQHNPASGTPQLTFEFKSANGQTLCASRQDIRPYPSLCGSSNRCNKVNITFSNPAIPQVPGFVLSGIATTTPLSETFFTQLTISLVNFERRTECPNTNPTPWQSLMQNPPVIQPAGLTNACVEVSNSASVVNTPIANSIQYTTQ
ncbi:MAG: hypothetical protein ACK4EX_01545 [Thermaurantimonas sp.]|uniref:hypothetical protein n=1 Tax=Thermaurantimonas sp. TaxID=2681568 RepID=UPI003919249E